MDHDQLVDSIQASASASEALSCLEHFERPSPLNELLAHAMQKRQVGPQALSRAIDVERSTVYRLLSGDRLTTRNVLLRIAIVLKLSLWKKRKPCCATVSAQSFTSWFVGTR